MEDIKDPKDKVDEIKRKIDKMFKPLDKKSEGNNYAKREDTQIAGFSVEDLDQYNSLPATVKGAVLKTHKTEKAIVKENFGEIKIGGKYTNEQLLNVITLKEEKVDEKPLKTEYYQLQVGKDKIDGGYNTDIYMTDKRIMLLNTQMSEYPSLKTYPEIKVSHTAEDLFRVFSIPTKHINSIKINMQNKVSASAVLEKRYMWWLIVIGILIAFFGTIWGLYDDDQFAVIISLIIGITVIIIALILKSYKAGKIEIITDKFSFIDLSVIEPLYQRRAVLHLTINTEVHNLKEIVEWVNKLQQRCKNIV